nr:hypothetical protein [uncultured Halomonas sp.]
MVHLIVTYDVLEVSTVTGQDHGDTKRIFLMNMKKACDQKKYREKLKDKKPLNTFINEDSKQRLDWLAKQRGQNINKTLEWLIDKEYDSHT